MECEICKMKEVGAVTVIHWEGGREFRILTCGECGDRIKANVIALTTNIVGKEAEQEIGQKVYESYCRVVGEDIVPWHRLRIVERIAWCNIAYVVIEWWKGRVAESMVRGKGNGES